MAGEFQDINKVSYEELTPELKKIIDDKAEQLTLTYHTTDSVVHITDVERANWNAIRDDIKRHIDDVFATIIGDTSSVGTDLVQLINKKLDSSIFSSFVDKLPMVAKTGSYNDLDDKPSNVSYSDTANLAYDAKKINGVRITLGDTAPSEPIEGKEIWLDPSGGKLIIKVFVNNKWVANSSVIL